MKIRKCVHICCACYSLKIAGIGKSFIKSVATLAVLAIILYFIRFPNYVDIFCTVLGLIRLKFFRF